MRFRVATRLLQIQRVLVRHGLDEMILAMHLFRPLRFAFYLSPATWFERRKGGPRGERMRLALEECRRMRIALPGLGLAESLYARLLEQGQGRLGTQALVLALATLAQHPWPEPPRAQVSPTAPPAGK